MNKPLVIYHADCTDGFAAAFAAWLKLGDEAEYLPMQHGKDFDLYANLEQREVYILDFSFPRAVMDALLSRAKRVVWLDHHKTAFEMAESEVGILESTTWPWRQKVFGQHYIKLDNNKSGALLAWEYFHPGTEVPMLIQHIDDRDRWQFKLEGSKELHAALASYKPWSFEQWMWFLGQEGGGWHSRYSILYSEGAAILRAQEQHVQSMVKQARKCVIPPLDNHPTEGLESFTGLALNTPMHVSEVGHELANASGTFGLVWYIGSDLRVKCSLRSNGDYDVSAIARVFGGGGHLNAAGFETDITTLMGWLKCP